MTTSLHPLESIWGHPSATVGKLISLTFDDGYQDFADSAVPIMKSCGVTGTVFLVSDHLGATNEWDIKLGEKSADLMSRETILKLLHQGFEFGSHTMTHVHLDQVDDGVQRLEIEKSKADLESALGVPMNVFCYPYGGLNDSAMKLVQEAGYSCAVSTRKGLNTRDTNRFCLNRIAVRNDTLLPVFVYKLWRAFRYGR